MTDAEYAEQKDRIIALSDKWLKPLGLGWWDIRLTFQRSGYMEPKQNTRDRSVAKCDCDWRYGHAEITFNMPLVAEQNDDDMENIVVHELMHVFLNEMRWARQDGQDDIDHEERVASTLTKALLWLRESMQPAVTAE
jgi:hypothetical protein